MSIADKYCPLIRNRPKSFSTNGVFQDNFIAGNSRIDFRILIPSNMPPQIFRHKIYAMKLMRHKLCHILFRILSHSKVFASPFQVMSPIYQQMVSIKRNGLQ